MTAAPGESSVLFKSDCSAEQLYDLPWDRVLFPVAAVSMAVGTVPWSSAPLTAGCHPGAPGAPAHSPVEVWE